MNNPPETVRDAIYRLDQELGSAAERSEDIATICAHITALAAEVEGLRAEVAACEAKLERVRSKRRASHVCRACGLPYNPQAGESEDCPDCGHDGTSAAMQEKPHG